MDTIRSSVPESLKKLIQDIVDDERSPIHSESEFVRMAVGAFATRMQSIFRGTVKDDEVMWDDIFHVIFQAGPDGISTNKLRTIFRGYRGIYYHLDAMRTRGLIDMASIESDGSNQRSGIWKVTDIGIFFHDIRAYKYIGDSSG